MVKVSRLAIPAQLLFLFHQYDFKSLIAQTQGGIHSGHPAADHQGPLVDRNDLLLERA